MTTIEIILLITLIIAGIFYKKSQKKLLETHREMFYYIAMRANIQDELENLPSEKIFSMIRERLGSQLLTYSHREERTYPYGSRDDFAAKLSEELKNENHR
jgi:hypothetical protein